ncbi:MAG TPA: ATP-binding protein [Polyangiaceae bacterium]|nr:ATP-binding protein [Polyangiaceae bacterium]
MSQELSRRRLDTLLGLLAGATAGQPGERLDDALDALLDATPATAAAAFDRDTASGPSAARRLPPLFALKPDRLTAALANLAERCLSTSAVTRLSDVRRDQDGVDGAQEFARLGAHTALGVPIAGERVLEGALVLLFADSAMLDAETLAYVDGVARITALCLERDRAGENEASFRAELGEFSSMATLALSTESVVQDLRAPVGALAHQHEELRAVVEQLASLSSPHETALNASVGELSELLKDMGTALTRVSALVAQLGARTGRDQRPSDLRLAELVRDAMTLTQPQLERRGILLIDELDSECSTHGRRDHLTQVIVHLVLNAADAAQVSAPPRIWLRLVPEPNQVVLTVEDNGPGVAAEHVAQIFKPFFSTKQPGQGRGLGLRICSEVVSAHGGHIEVAERAGGGACFRVHLPRADRKPSLRSAESATRDAPRATSEVQRVLLVDDDPVFSRSLQRALKPHDVRIAGSASEAEIALLDPSYEPDLVVCDVLLPGANGDTVHLRVSERRPELAQRFVFVTGGGLAKAEADYIRASGLLTLRKPLDVRTLLDLLSRSRDAIAGVRTLTHSDPPDAKG